MSSIVPLKLGVLKLLPHTRAGMVPEAAGTSPMMMLCHLAAAASKKARWSAVAVSEFQGVLPERKEEVNTLAVPLRSGPDETVVNPGGGEADA
jgi:hypothetical protein